VSGWAIDADDYVWPTGAAWMRGVGEPIPLGPGDLWDVGGALFRAVSLTTEGAAATAGDPSLAPPTTLTARYDTAHSARSGEATVVITGHMARVMSDLIAAGTALGWEDLARERWGDVERDLLRHRWDMQLRRLRQKLASHGLRTDLLRADGSGLLELVLGPDDAVVDQT